MKAITLKHPWAFAIARLGKDVENRSWKPPNSLIGQRIAIHGGAVPRGSAAEDVEDAAVFIYKRILDESGRIAVEKMFRRNEPVWITPGIVATATLERVVNESDSPWFVGLYGWVLTDVRPLDEPIACKGAQGLWDVPAEIAARLP